MNFKIFNVYGGVGSSGYVWFYFQECDRFDNLHSICEVPADTFCAAKEVVRWPPGPCVLLLTPPLWEGCWGIFWFEAEADPGGLAWEEPHDPGFSWTLLSI